jgi:signal transduction histidine kinase
MTTETLVDHLAAHRTIGSAPREELMWLAAHGTFRTFHTGEILSRPEDTVDQLLILLTGRISHIRHVGRGHRRATEVRAGEVGGLLPYSRMSISIGTTVVEEAAEVVELTRKDFPALIQNCPRITEIMVHVMTDRARYFTSAELRDEKMISLGKLAAGLAHELNNPASAAVRDAKAMSSALKTARESVHALARFGLTGLQLTELERIQDLCMTSGQPISGLALSDREEKITSWLNAHEVRNVPSEDLAGMCITVETLDRLSEMFHGQQLEVALCWIASECSAQLLSSNIERAASRIHALVASVKGFTRMDRAPDQEPVDIPSGLSDTVALLNGKARKKSVTVNLTIAARLPRVQGLGAEVNQVWMNLIDNAIDAAPLDGRVDVTAMHEGPAVVVRITDDGPGIPPEVRGNIFDPFFTTKAAGEGTGLGLDIVRRVVQWHNGQVEVDSEPGRTEFLVRLPCSGVEPE